MKNISGQRFGALVAVSPTSERRDGSVVWRCACDCGGVAAVPTHWITSGNTKSCGCRATVVKHGAARKRGCGQSREYSTWESMKQRCHNPRHPRFHDWGGRGIAVCERWRRDFSAFLADMGPRPRRTTIDRIDNDGNYEPGNCRWATAAEQSADRRVTRLS